MPSLFSPFFSRKPKRPKPSFHAQQPDKQAMGGAHDTPALTSKRSNSFGTEPKGQAMGDPKPSRSYIALDPASTTHTQKRPLDEGEKLHKLLNGKPSYAVETREGGSNEKLNDADAQLMILPQVQLIVHKELAGLKKTISDHILEMGRGIHSYFANQESQRLEQMVADLQAQLAHNLVVERNLQDEVEMLTPQQSVANSGSFEDGAPTPPLLQEALHAIQSALLTCAAKIAKQTKAHLPKFKGGRLQAIFHEQLCYCFFYKFESSSFGGSQIDAQSQLIFRRPDKDLKRHLYKEFTNYRAESVANLLARQQTRFRAFYSSRLDMFVLRQHEAPFPNPEQRQSVLTNLLRHAEKGTLSGDFARLAKTVWLLHKLAFAFEPTAVIFRVSEGMHFDAEYMESREGEDDAAECGAADVALMLAPGFTVRNFVLKAQVQLRISKLNKA